MGTVQHGEKRTRGDKCWMRRKDRTESYKDFLAQFTASSRYQGDILPP